MVALGLSRGGHSSRSASRGRSFSLGSTTLTGGLSLLRLSASLSFVGFNLGLDALLGLLVLELLLSLLGGFLDLLLTGQLLLGFVTLLGRLLANLL